MISTDTQQRFASLRWQLIVILLIIAVSTSAVFAVLFNRFLLDQYTKERQDALALASQQVNGLLAQQRQHLQQLASTLPVLTPEFDAPDGENRLFSEKAWSTMQLDAGLHSAYLFSPQGQMLHHWDGQDAKPAWRATILASVAREMPVSFVDCSDRCYVMSFAPILKQQQVTGVFAVSAPLAEIVLSFHKLSNADLVMLVPDAAQQAMRVEAASSPTITLEILKRTPALRQRQPALNLSVEHSGNRYQATVIAPSPDIAMTGVRLLLIEDVSKHVAYIQATTQQLYALVFSQLAILLMLIYALLARPLARLHRVAQALPLLGNGAFAEARQQITLRPAHPWNDEVDLMDRATVMLSHRLEQLEQDAVEHNRSLRSALKQVSREQAFASSLLDQAQALIVVSNYQGNVVTLNRYCTDMIGYSADHLVNTSLMHSPLLQAAEKEIHEKLQNLPQDETAPVIRHEVNVWSSDGVLHKIAWTHTWLPSTETGHGAMLSTGMDITERVQNEVKLAFLADHDPLTGCFNRRRFQVELERSLDTVRRHASLQGAVLYLDLDRFKNINDTRGHSAGDTILLQVVAELHKLLRNVDVVGRLGGDEFAIITLDNGRSGALSLAERINKQLGFINTNYLEISQRITASIGIAYFGAEDINATELMAQADMAMYQAKNRQRGSWHVYSPNDQVRENILVNLSWEKRITQGFSDDQFEVHLQPVMALADNTIQHYEVLLRLRLENGELAMPEQFISRAEHGGQIQELDRWVIRKALRTVANFPPEHQHTQIAINLSAINIGKASMLTALEQAIKASGIDPRRIIFELTETAAVSDFAAAHQFISAIRALGCAFSLDDFGSGFSSFYYLKHLPVDYIKIDGSFIRGLTDRPDDQIFVRAMVDLARGYGKKIVAEHVEDAAVLEMLREFGVNYVQGYHIGRPAPVYETFKT